MSDDDFDDFGGFESADPLEVTPQQQQVSDGGGTRDFDVLNQQVTSSFGLENATVNPLATNQPSGLTPWNMLAVANNNMQQQQEQVQPDPTGDTQHQTTAQSPWTLMATNVTSNVSSTGIINEATREELNVESTSVVEEKPVVNDSKLTILVKGLEERLQISSDEKQTLKLEIGELTNKLQNSTDKLEQMKAELQQQTISYDELQKRHAGELAAMKETNQKAIAIVIEEYKELCKHAILEQQLENSKKMQSLIEEERLKFEQTCNEQAVKFDQWKEEGENQQKEKLDRSIESLSNQFQDQLAKEKEILSGRITTELDLLKSQHEQLKLELVSTIDIKTNESIAHMERHTQEIIDSKVDELESHIKLKLKEVAETERDSCMEFWQKHSNENQQAMKTAITEAVTEHRQIMEKHMQDRIAADRAAQKKHLGAIDIFLDSARQHISTLTDDS